MSPEKKKIILVGGGVVGVAIAGGVAAGYYISPQFVNLDSSNQVDVSPAKDNSDPTVTVIPTFRPGASSTAERHFSVTPIAELTATATRTATVASTSTATATATRTSIVVAANTAVITSTGSEKLKGFIYGQPVWQSEEWAPLSQEYAKQRGLVWLGQAGGPLEKADKYLKDKGIKSVLQQTYIKFSADYLKLYPNTWEWAGDCHGLTHAQMLYKQFSRDPQTVNLQNGEKITFTHTDRVLLAAAFHSGDVMWRPYLGTGSRTYAGERVQENLEYFIDQLTKTKQPFIINAPQPGLPGFWYRTVIGVSEDKQTLLATNNNKPGKEIVSVKRTEVKEAYTPLTEKEAIGKKVDPRLLEEVPDEWKIPVDESLLTYLGIK